MNFELWKWLAWLHLHSRTRLCLLRGWRWFEVTLGRVPATLFVADVTGPVRRE
jgi:hypothetical protein